MATSGMYKKRLEGVESTDELKSLVKEASGKSIVRGNNTQQTEATSAVVKATAMLPCDEALSVLEQYSSKQKNTKTVIPISVVRAMSAVFASDEKLSDRLEESLSNTSLVFTPPPPAPELSAEQRKFKRRIERLKLRAEEGRYKNLTSNLGKPVEDDVTMRSMTYAASVGLNMIIAPLSFGVFMFFFAGKMFSWIGGEDTEPDPHKTDIGAIMAGVICGVGMLFIEMILFVIRTHEFDASLRKKSKRKSPSPFGNTKPKPKA